ncbi:MAG: ABC transporter permease [Agathobacter sp.]|uniref:ABC transporter permease n=1 Tax=Agathobacter sp. TaxID=2021311 RepID=UPI003992158E
MLENIRLSFRGIWSHKMRSFLTMLGIIIGIAAIIAIVSTIQGTNDQIEKNLIGSGSNNVKVTLQKDGYDIDLSYDSVPAGITEVSDSTLDQIKDIDHVESASLYKSRQNYNDVYYLNTILSGGTVLGIDSGYFDTCGYTIMKGRGFSQNDYDKSKKVALIDEKAQKALFQGESAIGKTIEIKGEPFSVVGIVTEKDSYELVINSIEDYYTYSNDSSAGNIFVPESVWPVIYRYDEPQNLILKTDSADNMAAAGKAAQDILNSSMASSDGSTEYKAQDLLEQAKQIQQLSQSTNMMLIWIAGISLLVGGIGVMNIMLVSVTERTSEIGLKKAIGAGKGAILGQFLTEAVVLTSIGGLVGVIVGVILSKVISVLNGTPTSINPAAAVLAVLFSMAIGIIFGILPSHKAANLNPIDALRHE